MDEMRIGSKFITGIVSKLLTKIIHKKLGYDIGFRINEMNVVIVNEKAQVHLNVDASIEKTELIKILNTFGI